uniref:WRKY19-like zinc finger domain-containing protein n=1 Tax=Corethron hystrix TaxID=216773 RepID=A0A7S1FMK4_9STRA|mmetsp:Transcript_13264/g.29218  ORF Transcript_13264/g.29218 Transcript_13264/m.29218 type:complete len:443 (+) Transcript_13264:102-1430(+)
MAKRYRSLDQDEKDAVIGLILHGMTRNLEADKKKRTIFPRSNSFYPNKNATIQISKDGNDPVISPISIVDSSDQQDPLSREYLPKRRCVQNIAPTLNSPLAESLLRLAPKIVNFPQDRPTGKKPDIPHLDMRNESTDQSLCGRQGVKSYQWQEGDEIIKNVILGKWGPQASKSGTDKELSQSKMKKKIIPAVTSNTINLQYFNHTSQSLQPSTGMNQILSNNSTVSSEKNTQMMSQQSMLKSTFCSIRSTTYLKPGSTIENNNVLPFEFVKYCSMESCGGEAVGRSPYCAAHKGIRRCEKEGCNKCAQGKTRFCIKHGGGRRCSVDGCPRSARDRSFCTRHGGGRRCSKNGCTKSAVGKGTVCTAHGGGKRCGIDNCNKSAQSGTMHCVRHGGGRKCDVEYCSRVSRRNTSKCMSHTVFPTAPTNNCSNEIILCRTILPNLN